MTKALSAKCAQSGAATAVPTNSAHCLPHFSPSKFALQLLKSGTAPGYDNIHPEFLIHLGPKALSWLSTFFSRVVALGALPKAWRKAKVIAIGKPGKDPKIAASYPPISLLSVCYKLLERVILQRISPLVDSAQTKLAFTNHEAHAIR